MGAFGVMVVIRTVQRPEHPAFDRMMRLRTEFDESCFDHKIAVHGEGELTGHLLEPPAWTSIIDMRGATDGTQGKAAYRIFKKFMNSGYKAIGVMDDDADWIHPKENMRRFKRMLRSDPTIGAAGPMSAIHARGRYTNKGIEIPEWDIIDRRPWATFGCQIMSAECLRKMDMSLIRDCIIRGDIGMFIGAALAGFHTCEVKSNFNHVCSHGHLSGPKDIDHFSRQMAKQEHDYNLLIKACKAEKRQDLVTDLQNMLRAEQRRFEKWKKMLSGETDKVFEWT